MVNHVSRAGLVACALLLQGCFVAENDDADPIIPADSIAYPLKTGPARECQDGGECKRAEIVRLAGGYELRTWNAGDGADAEPSVQSYRLRAMKGGGIPANTYLAQSIRDNAEERTLGLMARRSDGGWEQLSPQCESLRPDAFVAFINDGWLRTDDEQLDSMRCEIRRDGLTDDRLYTIFEAVKKSSSPTVIYEGE
jgi:hypothetical protein